MMSFDEIVVKESPGLCRCCLSEGCYKDMGTDYSWMSEREVYADMLLECFDISVSFFIIYSAPDLCTTLRLQYRILLVQIVKNTQQKKNLRP